MVGPPLHPVTLTTAFVLVMTTKKKICIMKTIHGIRDEFNAMAKLHSSKIPFSVDKEQIMDKYFIFSFILLPRAHDPSGLWQVLWLSPSPEVRDSRTSRQIWQIWLVENTKRILCAYSENRVWPELSIPATGQKDHGLWGREWRVTFLVPVTRLHSAR